MRQVTASLGPPLSSALQPPLRMASSSRRGRSAVHARATRSSHCAILAESRACGSPGMQYGQQQQQQVGYAQQVGGYEQQQGGYGQRSLACGSSGIVEPEKRHCESSSAAAASWNSDGTEAGTASGVVRVTLGGGPRSRTRCMRAGLAEGG